MGHARGLGRPCFGRTKPADWNQTCRSSRRLTVERISGKSNGLKSYGYPLGGMLHAEPLAKPIQSALRGGGDPPPNGRDRAQTPNSQGKPRSRFQMASTLKGREEDSSDA
jgi:hypothetical protein